MTSAPHKHFLLVFDPSTGREADVVEFDDTTRALDAYRDTERRYRGNAVIQVVLIGADSLETVKATHSNYFGDSSLERVKAALRPRSRKTAV